MYFWCNLHCWQPKVILVSTIYECWWLNSAAFSLTSLKLNMLFSYCLNFINLYKIRKEILVKTNLIEFCYSYVRIIVFIDKCAYIRDVHTFTYGVVMSQISNRIEIQKPNLMKSNVFRSISMNEMLNTLFRFM